MYGYLVYFQWICLESGLCQEVIGLPHCFQQRCCAPGHGSTVDVNLLLKNKVFTIMSLF